jgi:hypothetical protein
MDMIAITFDIALFPSLEIRSEREAGQLCDPLGAQFRGAQ